MSSDKSDGFSCLFQGDLLTLRNIWVFKAADLLTDRRCFIVFNYKDEKCKWQVDFNRKKEDPDYVAITLLLLNEIPRFIRGQCAFRVSYPINAKEENVVKSQGVMTFKHKIGVEFPKCIDTKAFGNASLLQPPNNLIKVCLTLEMIVNGIDDASIGAQVRQDFLKMFENSIHTDVTFVVGNKELKAHKAILAARSIVFACMFEHQLSENTTNIINIVDVNYDVLQDVMRFVYSGDVPTNHSSPFDLLYAADKYALDGLKIFCAEVLAMGITEETAAKTLEAANMHSCLHLKEIAMFYILTNSEKIMKTDGWKNMVLSHPYLIEEVCKRLVEELNFINRSRPLRKNAFKRPYHQN